MQTVSRAIRTARTKMVIQEGQSGNPMKWRDRLRIQSAEQHLHLAESLRYQIEDMQRDLHSHRQSATRLFRDVLLSLDMEYATEDAAWQEGAPGMESCRQSDALRDRIMALETMTGSGFGQGGSDDSS